MKDLFKEMIRDEYQWVYTDSDCTEQLIEGFNGDISEEEYDKYVDTFIEDATNRYCRDEYIISSMHEFMHDIMIDTIKDYVLDKEQYISNNVKIDEVEEYDRYFDVDNIIEEIQKELADKDDEVVEVILETKSGKIINYERVKDIDDNDLWRKDIKLR